FLTLFLGLIAGVHPVAVSVTAPVSVVEVELDGAVAGRARSAPWTVSVDFGPDLAPHELVARGLDAEGHEVSRARQWINLPRSPASAGPPRSSSSGRCPTRRRCSTWAAAGARCSTRTGEERRRHSIPRLCGWRCASAIWTA